MSAGILTNLLWLHILNSILFFYLWTTYWFENLIGTQWGKIWKSETIFLKIFFIFLDRVEGREGKASMCGCLAHTPNWGSGLQPRHVPWLGIELKPLWFSGQHSIHWPHQPVLIAFFDGKKCMCIYICMLENN